MRDNPFPPIFNRPVDWFFLPPDGGTLETRSGHVVEALPRALSEDQYRELDKVRAALDESRRSLALVFTAGQHTATYTPGKRSE